MQDLEKLEKYRENNRIEAKRALGGLPHSIWETYSAFANTLGGILLLGVEEAEDKSLRAAGLSDPEKLVKEFWDTVNNANKISVNILTDKDVTIRQVDGRKIIVVQIPRAQRYDRPVYLEGNPLSGTYRRNGEGDYRCTKEEVFAMTRDASVKTQDMQVLEEMNTDVFHFDSVHSYRMRMKYARPGHVWEDLEDIEFLFKIGAVGRGSEGKLHPTAAGLLMFGNEYEIVREYPRYFLDYQEQMDETVRWTDRIVSSSGDWSGNVYDFYFRVYNRITQSIKVPFRTEGGSRVEDTSVHVALREALANCLVNADYYGPRGLVIIRRNDRITFSNPGGFRIEIDAAKSGGVSDPRNSAMLKMFNLIDIGERAGSGIPNIYRVWETRGWEEPILEEQFEPERTLLSLPIKEIGNKNKAEKESNDKSVIKNGDKESAIKIGDKKSAIKAENKMRIIEFLAGADSAKASEIAEYVGLKPSRTRDYLKELISEDIVAAKGANRNRTYQLKR